MPALLSRVTVFCFAASYAVALALELWHLFRPRPILRYAALGFGAAGILAHAVFVVLQPLPLSTAFGSLLFLALILAVFYFYGAIHHYRLAWGLFVLPLVLGLVGVAYALQPATPSDPEGRYIFGLRAERFWGATHGILVLLAAVGVCVGFLASLMYFVQLQRLRAKTAPSQGVRLWSLERLEAMNRRAILLAFPLLTAGLIVGIALQLQRGAWEGFSNPKVLSTIGLWLVFAILLYLRYAVHARGRQLALWTMVAFALLVIALIVAHPFADATPPFSSQSVNETQSVSETQSISERRRAVDANPSARTHPLPPLWGRVGVGGGPCNDVAPASTAPLSPSDRGRGAGGEGVTS
ncbi:MAG: cytochrome c biogenesis protein CcsA [Gemmataceae bacterium]